MRLEGLAGAEAVVRPHRRLPYEPIFHALEAAPAPPCAAVDGSHAVLADTGSIWVVAVRAAGLVWPGPAEPAATDVLATTADEAQGAVDEAYAQHGLPAPRAASAEGFAEAHRGLAELQAATAAVHAVPEGGLLLVDGALTHLPEAAQALAERVLDRATASGVHVAGVSKRSGLAAAGVPLVPAIMEAARTACPGAAWWSPLPASTAVVAKLHPRSVHAFRIDAEETALPWLADLARDAVYLGYPYPLAKVHNLVAITRAEARRLRERLERTLGADALRLRDFHAVLDRNVPR